MGCLEATQVLSHVTRMQRDILLTFIEDVNELDIILDPSCSSQPDAGALMELRWKLHRVAFELSHLVSHTYNSLVHSLCVQEGQDCSLLRSLPVFKLCCVILNKCPQTLPRLIGTNLLKKFLLSLSYPAAGAHSLSPGSHGAEDPLQRNLKGAEMSVPLASNILCRKTIGKLNAGQKISKCNYRMFGIFLLVSW